MPTPGAGTAEAAAAAAKACAIGDFYWEIGDAKGKTASGSIGATAANTSMQIASASKWFYSAYVAEIRKGKFTADDMQYLRFMSGFVDFKFCSSRQTVGQCAVMPPAGCGVLKVCTLPSATCTTAAGRPPTPPGQAWFYGIGHWIEPDGAFSSPGAFGFVPWISADKKTYGLVANDTAGPTKAIACAQSIRRAYLGTKP